MKHYWMISLSLLALPGFALAASPNYTYLEGGYQYIDIDDVDDGSGIGLGGSFAVTENVHVVAGYSDFELDTDIGNIDVSSLRLGVGFNLPMDNTFDLVFRGGYTENELDSNLGNANDDGLFLTGGFRMMFSEQLELNGNVEYVDLDDSGDDTALSFGARYGINEYLSLGASVSFSDDSTGFNVGLSYYPVP